MNQPEILLTTPSPNQPCKNDWNRIYRRYLPFWLALAKSHGLSSAEARDAVHAVVCVLLADPSKVFQSAEHIRNYVARAIINRSIVEFNRPDRAPWGPVDLEAVLSRGSEPLEPADQAVTRCERNSLLRAALLRLPRRGYEVIKLRFYCGFSFKEMSSILRLPISTLKSREDAALRRIRKFLNRNGFYSEY